jgi:prepilin-type N-terminal cleavage/methylation domain-containing protein
VTLPFLLNHRQALRPVRRRVQTGFTFVELALVIAVLAVLSTFAIASFANGDEIRDASMVQAAQGSLQSIVSQGSIRMDQRPDQLDSGAILTAFRTVLGQSSATSSSSVQASVNGGIYTVTIPARNRSATFQVASNGDVMLIGLNNFPSYTVDKSSSPWSIKKGT